MLLDSSELDPYEQPWCLDQHVDNMLLFDDQFSSEGLFPGQWEVPAIVSHGLSKLIDKRDAEHQPKTSDPAMTEISRETVSSTLFLVVCPSWQHYTQFDSICLPVRDRHRAGFQARLERKKMFLLHHLHQAASSNCQLDFISGKETLCVSTLFSSLPRRIISMGRERISSPQISEGSGLLQSQQLWSETTGCQLRLGQLLRLWACPGKAGPVTQ